jgi:ferredoxin
MADKKDQWPENTKGKFYVDKTCIACVACAMAAPNNFKMMDTGDGHAFMAKQPQNAAEEEACREAMAGCPVEAIGDDGES